MNSLYEKSERESYHSKRVSILCEKISILMQYEDEKVKLMKLVGLFHDIGKIGVPEEILNKDGKLDDSEWKSIKKHPEAGWRILSSVKEFAEVSDYVLAHLQNSKLMQGFSLILR